MDVEAVFGGSGGGGNSKGDFLPVGGRGGIDGAGEGEGREGGNGGEKGGVCLSYKLLLDIEGFLPFVIAVFFDFDVVFFWVKVDGVVGCGGELALDVDLGSFGVGGGCKKTGSFDGTVFGGAVAFGPADGGKGSGNDKDNGCKKD